MLKFKTIYGSHSLYEDSIKREQISLIPKENSPKREPYATPNVATTSQDTAFLLAYQTIDSNLCRFWCIFYYLITI